jgi:hypothetical protein
MTSKRLKDVSIFLELSELNLFIAHSMNILAEGQVDAKYGGIRGQT